MDGVLNLNKPSGPTSHDVVARVRRIFGQKKVGHAGTLDPPASGVLLVCLADATRIVEFLMSWRKSYRATAVFGATTDTEDSTGAVTGETDASYVTRETLAGALGRFVGTITQVPPMVSAVRHQGRRLYELAREGQVVERAPRTVEIYALSLLDFKPGVRAQAVLDVECSKGTYIRTLCADIGRELGCGGYMSSLVRTAVGRFRVEDSISLEKLESLASEGRLAEAVHSLDEVLSDLPAIEVRDDEVARVIHGNPVILPQEPDWASGLAEDSPIRIRTPDGRLLALGHVCHTADGTVQICPKKVFRLPTIL